MPGTGFEYSLELLDPDMRQVYSGLAASGVHMVRMRRLLALDESVISGIDVDTQAARLDHAGRNRGVSAHSL